VISGSQGDLHQGRGNFANQTLQFREFPSVHDSDSESTSKFGELAKQSQKCLRRIWGEYQTSIKNAQPGSVVTRSMANANAEAPTEADVNAQDLTISPAEERTNADMASGVANDTAATNASRTAPVAAQ
jgi:propanediol dehydratase small subunit